MADIELAQTPEPRQGFRVGDMVYEYMGTSAGTRAHRTVAYIGTVVGFHEEERKLLVSNNICPIGSTKRSCQGRVLFIFCLQ